MLRTKHLRRSFFSVLIISLTIPFLIGVFYHSTSYKNSLLNEYHTTQKNNASTLAEIISKYIWFYDMRQLKHIINKYSESQKQIEKLSIIDVLNKEVLYKVEKENGCEVSVENYTLIIPVNIKQKKFKTQTIANLHYTYSTCLLNKTMQDNINLILFINIVQFIIAIVFLTWLLNIRIIQPANILVKQSRANDTAKLFTNISHQWRQPLSEISNHLINIRTLLFIKEEKDLTKMDTLLQKSEDVVLHLSDTIDTFRKFYKTDKDKKEFYIEKAITETLSLIKQTLKYNNIEVHLNLESNVNIIGYKNDLIHALLNIFSNTIDIFTQRSKENRKIYLSVFKKNDFICITIEDNAGGIIIQPIESVFELHISLKKHGTGLGLYMTRELLKNNNGTISAKNTEKGALFTIELQNTSETTI